MRAQGLGRQRAASGHPPRRRGRAWLFFRALPALPPRQTMSDDVSEARAPRAGGLMLAGTRSFPRGNPGREQSKREMSTGAQAGERASPPRPRPREEVVTAMLSEQRGQPSARAGPHCSPRGWGGRCMRIRWWNGRNGCTRSTCFAALTQPLLRKRGMCPDTPNAPGTRPARVRGRTHAHVQDMEQDEDYEFDYEDSDQVRLGRADVLFSCSVSCCCLPLTRWLGERGGGRRRRKGRPDSRNLLFSCSVSCCCSPVPSLVRCPAPALAFHVLPLGLGRTKMGRWT